MHISKFLEAGNLTPVPPVQHAGALASAERAASRHCSVRQGGREKATTDGGRGDAGEWGEGLSGLRKTTRVGYLFQISGAGLDGGGQQLAGGGRQPEEGAEEFGTADKDPETGGCQTKVLRDVFQGGGTGGADFRVGDVGADPPHGTGPGKFSTQGRALDNWKIAKETEGGGMGIPTTGGIDGGGGIWGDRGLHLKESENVRAIHCDEANYGPLREDGA